jgi:hypothetical protein
MARLGAQRGQLAGGGLVGRLQIVLTASAAI